MYVRPLPNSPIKYAVLSFPSRGTGQPQSSKWPRARLRYNPTLSRFCWRVYPAKLMSLRNILIGLPRSKEGKVQRGASARRETCREKCMT
jgi:hypothetical protein